MLTAAHQFQCETIRLRQQHVAEGIERLQAMALRTPAEVSAHEQLLAAIDMENCDIEAAMLRTGMEPNALRRLLEAEPRND